MRHEAIRNLYPNVIVIRDDVGCFDKDNNPVQVDEQLVKVETDRLYADYMKLDYARKRQPEYPPLEDLADAMYWQSKGDDSKMNEYIAICESVKNKYPKAT